MMQLSDFDYRLPEELIAQEPLADRAASRMLVVNRAAGTFEDRMFRDFPGYVHAGDCVVLNDSRVFPSRLLGHREHGTGGRVEVFLTKQLSPDGLRWEALVRPGRKMRTGERVIVSGELSVEILGRGEFGERVVRLVIAKVPGSAPASVSGGDPEGSAGHERRWPAPRGAGTVLPDESLVWNVLDRAGHVPLPPYIRRPDTMEDRERYQTVFARDRGSVAAPTAGLHFTPEILEACRAAGAEIARVTLHVGLGTFQPLHDEVIEQAHLHSERVSIPPETILAMDAAKRVIAVGTTSVRAIESMAIDPAREETELFIYPEFQFQRTGAMLTNFHLPKSSLLVLVCAFAGRELALAAYRHAVESRYRFFSYGDCMLIV